ncbi:hypothetical protein OQA88_3829 [Cercophora sp. LCS_1]
MAKSRNVTPAAAASASASQQTTTATAPTPAPAAPAPVKAKPTTSGKQSRDQVVLNIANYYQEKTPQRTKLIDAFMAFLVVVGALQFVYCVLAGNYPFNAFLSGFSATVGQFVLTASLRIQTTEANKSDFPSVSPERAFADYVVCSLILHFFCVNFIN